MDRYLGDGELAKLASRSWALMMVIAAVADAQGMRDGRIDTDELKGQEDGE